MPRGAKTTQEDYIKRMKGIFGEQVDLSKAIYTGVHKNCILRCIKHDTTYEQSPHNSFTGNYGCRTCHKDNLSVICKGEELQARRRETCLKIYGTEVSSQSDTVKAKALETANKNGGWAQQREVPRQKTIQTNLDRRGVTSVMHDPAVAQKQLDKSYRQRKEYKFPSGCSVNIQGHEDLMLDTLLSENIPEEHIKVSRSEQPEIWYDFEGKKRRYYPDAFVNNDMVCEAKSEYTLKSKILENLAKRDAVLKMGLKFRYFVYNKKKQLLSENEIENLIKVELTPHPLSAPATPPSTP